MRGRGAVLGRGAGEEFRITQLFPRSSLLAPKSAAVSTSTKLLA